LDDISAFRALESLNTEDAAKAKGAIDAIRASVVSGMEALKAIAPYAETATARPSYAVGETVTVNDAIAESWLPFWAMVQATNPKLKGKPMPRSGKVHSLTSGNGLFVSVEGFPAPMAVPASQVSKA
jgi:hypothetical protein